MNKLIEGKKIFDIEIEALKKTRDALDDTFVRILDMIIECKGKVIITGIGKPGHIAAKLAATFSSLGTPSFYMHPAEAMHGDLGMISPNDVVIAISYSGESDEIIHILPNIKFIGAVLIGITGNPHSTLAHASDIVQILPEIKEACYLGLAPTSSTTVTLAYGDALAVVASEIYGFKDTDFGKFHPAGSLGKKLIFKVDDLMSDNSIVHEDATVKEVIEELCKNGLGMVSIVNEEGYLAGVITDGDIRRQLQKEVDIYSLNVRDIMSKTPVTVMSGELAITALNTLRRKNISCMPVLKNGEIIGIIRMQAIINAGIIG